MRTRTCQCLFFVFLAILLANTSFGANLVAETEVVNYSLDPEVPKIGKPTALYVHVNTEFDKNELVLEVLIDGQAVELFQTSSSLWVADLGIYDQVKSHMVNTKVYVRNAKEAGLLKDAIEKLNKKIENLNEDLANETDPIEIADIQEKIATNTRYRDHAQAKLDGLNVLVREKSFVFQIEGDGSNTNYPKITNVKPNIALKSGGTIITVTGENFPTSGAEVVIEGLNATVLSATNTEIKFESPAFATQGAKAVEVRFPNESPVVNAVENNDFFVTNDGIIKNVRPVGVVADGFIAATVGNPVSLLADSSYDENSDAISFEWKVVRREPGSAITNGTLLDPLPVTTFTPDVPGIFVVKLVLRETSTTQAKASKAAFVTIQAE